MKITDSNYSLPEILAESIHGKVKTGATEPLIVMGHDKKLYSLSKCIVKPHSFPQMSVQGSMKELIASFIAHELDLVAAEPVLIEITDQFCELYKGNPLFDNLKNSIGLNFGSIYKDGIITWNESGGRYLANKYHQDLLNIFIFDMFIENTDRTKLNPNLFMKDENIHIFDHEKAFYFMNALSFERNSQPFIPSPGDIYTAENHVLYPYLKGKEFVSDEFFLKLGDLNTLFWEAADKLVPDSWKCDKYEMTKPYLSQKIEFAERYKQEIRRILL